MSRKPTRRAYQKHQRKNARTYLAQWVNRAEHNLKASRRRQRYYARNPDRLNYLVKIIQRIRNAPGPKPDTLIVRL